MKAELYVDGKLIGYLKEFSVDYPSAYDGPRPCPYTFHGHFVQTGSMPEPNPLTLEALRAELDKLKKRFEGHSHYTSVNRTGTPTT